MAFLNQIRLSLLRPSKCIWRVALVIVLLLPPAWLAASPLAGALKDAQLRGTSTFRYLGLPIYDAKLFTPRGGPFSWNEDFGLQLTYRKSLKQKALVQSTLDEIERQGNKAPSQTQLEQCFQAVSKGDSYLAISEGPNQVDFWRNGNKTCALSSLGIKRAFMSIFLGDDTRSANFTRQLKGQ
ncbi:hypothetical protein [Ruegeria arenilitoris]|uniref:hypothetical protein n=1 Tax=Ruegeria arenilitoris TaxID=1173585 RepID=UPI00147F31C8|nr:hypothetical protein [Ruegeria arenilitoris]